MITVCGGWRGIDDVKVHHVERVLVPEDGRDDRISHGICWECKEAFLERLTQLHEDERGKA
jgi:hypothetical protein